MMAKTFSKFIVCGAAVQIIMLADSSNKKESTPVLTIHKHSNTFLHNFGM
jgi:hypothetical protein